MIEQLYSWKIQEKQRQTEERGQGESLFSLMCFVSSYHVILLVL